MAERVMASDTVSRFFKSERGVPAGIVLAVAINGDVPGALRKFGDAVERLVHFLLAPHDADEILHHFLQIMLHLIRPFGAAAGLAPRSNGSSAWRAASSTCASLIWPGAVFLGKFRGEFAGALAEYNQIGQRISAQPVRPVQARGRFARGKQPGHGGHLACRRSRERRP